MTPMDEHEVTSLFDPSMSLSLEMRDVFRYDCLASIGRISLVSNAFVASFDPWWFGGGGVLSDQHPSLNLLFSQQLLRGVHYDYIGVYLHLMQA